MFDPLDSLPVALRVLAPKADPLAWTKALTPSMRERNITNPKRIAALLGQVVIESGRLTTFSENLNYSAERMCAVWPSRFPNVDAAAPYAHNPEKLANHVYAGRMGNGPEASGDGWRYRGSGALQVTGKELYMRCAFDLNRDIDGLAEWMQTIEGAAASACWFWGRPELKMNDLADRWDIEKITTTVNGSTASYSTRLSFSGLALKILDVSVTKQMGVGA